MSFFDLKQKVEVDFQKGFALSQKCKNVEEIKCHAHDYVGIDATKGVFIYGKCGFDGSDIKNPVLVINQTQYQETSLSSIAQRALVGSLFGGVGAIIGGVTARKTNVELVKSVGVKVSIPGLSIPLEIKLYVKGSFLNKYTVDEAKHYAEKLHAYFLYMIESSKAAKMPELERKLGFIRASFEAGTLTEEEYEKAKNRLLG